MISDEDIKQVIDKIACPEIKQTAEKHILNCPLCRAKIEREVSPYLHLASIFKGGKKPL